MQPVPSLHSPSRRRTNRRTAWHPGWVLAAAALVATTFSQSPALADDGAPGNPANARGIARVAPDATEAGVRAVLPRLVGELANSEADGAFEAALQDALAEPEHAGLRAALGADASGLITSEHGLTPLGEAALRWIREAEWHGAPRAVQVASSLPLEQLLAARPPPPGRVSASAFEAEAVLRAWKASAGSDQRLREVARSFGDHDAVKALTDRRVRAAASLAEVRAQLEVGTLRALAELHAALPARASDHQVLKAAGDERDALGRGPRQYLPPEAIWTRAAQPEALPADFEAVVRAARAGASVMDRALGERMPAYPQYTRLLEAARAYSKLCAAGGWEPITWKAPGHKKRKSRRRRKSAAAVDAPGGDARAAALAAALHRRLAAEGFASSALNAPESPATEAGLRRYQDLRNLEPSGTLDRATVDALNVPCERRLATLRLNLRRWRHSALGDKRTYVHANLPSFEVRYVREGSLRAEKKTVVGSGRWYWEKRRGRRVYRNSSPILTDQMKQVILNPTWTPPPRLIREDLRAKIASDPDFLVNHNYTARTLSNGRLFLVQGPGKGNSLGAVKLLFPNSESVYMHDTPQKKKFERARRDFSHGCIRVHDAVDLAATILEDDFSASRREFDRPRFVGRAGRDKTWTYRLREPIDVVIEYYTASVTEQGDVRFHPDIYDYDRMFFEGAAAVLADKSRKPRKRRR